MPALLVSPTPCLNREIVVNSDTVLIQRRRLWTNRILAADTVGNQEVIGQISET